ncbi:MAG: hypothetical protein FD187_1863 [bacterium]|nr:MAG: hypothetical protein FD142_1745 [bacterium]KAF0148440.1 MAG: hypothetical protein FD187_1863 [bacterium]KAF0167984.1 MAG: hypothetical protein FD158_1711 [bacterium]TXT21273.1 MAG: hypothetical protein FD132_783 [bacterium]
MDIFRPPATSNHKDSAWERIENYVKEERPLQPIRKIIVKGSVDVVFWRCDKPMLIVAGSGDILVRGNPPHRDHSVAGSGKIKFR